MAEKKREFLCHQCFEDMSSWYDIFTYNHLDEIPSKYKDDIETEDEFESLKNSLKTCNLDYIEDMPLGPVVKCCLKDCHYWHRIKIFCSIWCAYMDLDKEIATMRPDMGANVIATMRPDMGPM